MDWIAIVTLIIAGLTFLVGVVTLVISIREKLERCKVSFFPGFSVFGVPDNAGGTHEHKVPGYEIVLVNSGKQDIYVDSVRVVSDVWDEGFKIWFRSKTTWTRSGLPIGGDQFMIDARRKVRSSISHIVLAEKTIEEKGELEKLSVWVEVTLEPGKVFHSKSRVVTKEQLEEAIKHKERLSSK